MLREGSTRQPEPGSWHTADQASVNLGVLLWGPFPSFTACGAFPSGSEEVRAVGRHRRQTRRGQALWPQELPQLPPYRFHRLGLASGGCEARRSQDTGTESPGGADQGRTLSSLGRGAESCRCEPAGRARGELGGERPARGWPRGAPRLLGSSLIFQRGLVETRHEEPKGTMETVL